MFFFLFLLILSITNCTHILQILKIIIVKFFDKCDSIKNLLLDSIIFLRKINATWDRYKSSLILKLIGSLIE